jgi:hypothetical protein
MVGFVHCKQKLFTVESFWKHKFNLTLYCDTPQSKGGSNREYKVCLRKRAILRLLDQKRNVAITGGNGSQRNSHSCAWHCWRMPIVHASG